jgi:hypothetical protein
MRGRITERRRAKTKEGPSSFLILRRPTLEEHAMRDAGQGFQNPRI